MDETHVEKSQRTSRWRKMRHDLFSLSGGALLGVGLVLNVSTTPVAWILVLVGIAVAITGIVWSARIALTDAHAWEPQLKSTKESICAPDTHTDTD
ncbi:MAG: hypothetical protein ACXVCX_14395 [Ktedonobacterales bacterium]